MTSYAERKRAREKLAAEARRERALDFVAPKKPDPVEHAPLRQGLPREQLIFMSPEDAAEAEAIRNNNGFKPAD